MHRFLAAELAAEHLAGAIGDHLIEVHVALGAGAGLPYHQRKVIVELALDHLACGAGDGRGPALIELAELAIGLGRGQFDDAERMDDRDRHPVLADAKILPAAFGLRAPVAIGGDLDRTETIGLGAGRSVSRYCRGFGHEQCPLRRELRNGHSIMSPVVSRADYFLRKRSSRTTSAPSLGFVGTSSPVAAGSVAATGKAEGAGTAGRLAAGVSAASSLGSNCSPNFTEGSRKLL